MYKKKYGDEKDEADIRVCKRAGSRRQVPRNRGRKTSTHGGFEKMG